MNQMLVEGKFAPSESPKRVNDGDRGEGVRGAGEGEGGSIISSLMRLG